MAIPWSDATNLPSVRRGAAAIACRGWLYSIGGQVTTSGAVAAVYKAQIQPNGTLGAWSAETALTTARRDGHGFLNGINTLMIQGGFDNSGNGLPTTAYATQTSAVTGALSAWASTGSCPSGYPQGGFSVTNTPGGMYRFGGDNTNGQNIYAASVTDGIFVLANTMPADRRNHCSVRNGVYVYVIGGFTTTNTADVIFASSATEYGTWTTTTPLPETSYNGGAFISGGYIYVAIGGNSATTWSNKIYRGTFGAGGTITSWELHSNLPAARARFDYPVVYNGRAYVVGGETSGTTMTNAVSMLWASPQLPLTSVKPLGFNDGIGY